MLVIVARFLKLTTVNGREKPRAMINNVQTFAWNLEAEQGQRNFLIFFSIFSQQATEADTKKIKKAKKIKTTDKKSR